MAEGAEINTIIDGQLHGAGIRIKGKTPLDLAVEKKHTEIANLLRKHGGKHGAINDAVAGGYIQAVEEHLAAGADVNSKDWYGYTPLHIAAARNSPIEIAELLIANGADVNAKDYFGSTPLHSAVSEGHKEIAKLLVAAGADVNVKDGWGGDTPLDWAEEGSGWDSPEIKAAKKEIALLLREHGGKTTAELGALIDAAKNGDFEAIKQAIADGVDVNVKGGWGELTPLHEAAGGGHKEIVELLIVNGADVNAKDEGGLTPLHFAASGGHKEIVELLIVNGADVNAKDESGLTPLHSAVGSARLVVEMLIAAGADVNAKIDPFGDTPLDWAIGGEAETAGLLREHGGKTGEELPPATLFEAVYRDDLEGMKDLLAEGADVNAMDKDGNTPLHIVTHSGHKEMIKLLISNGAHVNAKDEGGWTPLHFAASGGHKEIAELMLANGADVNAKDFSDYTPLHRAAGGGHNEMIKLLISNGADVNAKGRFGTPIHNAVSSGYKEIVQLLVDEGADVNAKEWRGKTPLDMATPLGRQDLLKYQEIAELLRKYGGKYGTLHSAATGGDIEEVKELLAAGSDVNVVDGAGYSPLHYAIKSNRPEVVELLIVNGADVNETVNTGETPLEIVRIFEWDSLEIKAAKKEIADLLRKHGGKTGVELALMPPRLAQHNRFAFSFDTIKGKVYEVQDSFDLLNWEVIKTYTGTGKTVRFDEERDHDPPKIFYRVKVVE